MKQLGIIYQGTRGCKVAWRLVDASWRAYATYYFETRGRGVRVLERERSGSFLCLPACSDQTSLERPGLAAAWRAATRCLGATNSASERSKRSRKCADGICGSFLFLHARALGGYGDVTAET